MDLTTHYMGLQLENPIVASASPLSAAEEQEVPGHTETIEYEDDRGNWHTETAKGRDRPHTLVKDQD